MFKKLFNSFEKQNTKSIYIAGWMGEVNGSELCEDILSAQTTKKENILGIGEALELVFADNELIEIFYYEEGIKSVRKISDLEKLFKYKEYEIHNIYNLHFDINGLHYLGGTIPQSFNIPYLKENKPFQYLGLISNSDSNFNWLPFDINLVCPIYSYFNYLYLDYSNPNSPTLLNNKDFENVEFSYEEYSNDSLILDDKIRFNFIESDMNEALVSAGLPFWSQTPDIPKSPINNKRMKFLCEISSDNYEFKDEPQSYNKLDNKYYDRLSFGDATLYVFFEPESKIACYLWQGT